MTIVGRFFTFDPKYISHSDIDELNDEDAAMREIHEIRLKMYEERMKQGLSVSDWFDTEPQTEMHEQAEDI